MNRVRETEQSDEESGAGGGYAIRFCARKEAPEKYPGEYLALAVIKLISSHQLHIHATRVSQLLSQAAWS
jgi:hypothetical protein